MKNEYDVVIIGAGPAGLSCAIELQKNSDKSVLLLEKNKEIGPKVCAGGLTPKVEKLGFSLCDAGVLFSSMKIKSPWRTKIISGNKPIIGTINRGKLGKIMLQQVSSKVEIVTGVKADKIENGFIEANGQRIKYKYLVGADGSNSIVRKFLGLENKKFLMTLQYIIPRRFESLEMFVDSSLFGCGYAWIFPHKNYTSIGCGQYQKFMGKISLKDNFEKWLKKMNINVEGSKLEGGTINFDYQGFEFGNKFLVGGAGGFTSGLTGEGIYFAMVSGIEVAKKIKDPLYKCNEISKILKIKFSEEKYLNIMSFLLSINKFLLSLFFMFIPEIISFKGFGKRILNVNKK